MKNKNRVIKFLLFINFVMILCFISVESVIAESTNIGLSVKAILPKNQYDEAHTFFDLLMQPGQQQTIQLELNNSTEEEMRVNVQLHPAITNYNGLITYDSVGVKEKKNKLAINNVASIENETISIPKYKSKIININLSMPTEIFDGIILGGIKIFPIKDNNNSETQANYSLENEIAYVIGLQLRETENVEIQEIEFKRAYATQNLGDNQIAIKLNNPTNHLFNNLTYKGKIYKKGSSKVIHESKAEHYRFAPQSAFIYGIDWGNKTFEKGDYEVHLAVVDEDTKKEWLFKDFFTITENQAKELINQDEIKSYSLKSIPWIGIGILSIFLIFIVLIYSKKNKKGSI